MGDEAHVKQETPAAERCSRAPVQRAPGPCHTNFAGAGFWFLKTAAAREDEDGQLALESLLSSFPEHSANGTEESLRARVPRPITQVTSQPDPAPCSTLQSLPADPSWPHIISVNSRHPSRLSAWGLLGWRREPSRLTTACHTSTTARSSTSSSGFSASSPASSSA